MIAVGIDPGTNKSGVVVFDNEAQAVTYSAELANEDLLLSLRGGGPLDVNDVDQVYVENIEAMGLAVGKTTFQTCIWIGRFLEAFAVLTGGEAHLVSRGDEKTVLCGAATFRNPETGKRKAVGDSQIRRALIERFPGTGGGATPQVGTKTKPGPLYGVSGHCWQALAVVVTGLEIGDERCSKN